MDSDVKKKSIMQAKTIAELLPGICGILSKDTVTLHTIKKQPRASILPRTAEKMVKPFTIAEMRADLLALKAQSPRRPAQTNPSTKRKGWNSSVKVVKTISHTSDGQMKHNSVKKVLNFQPKAKPLESKAIILNSETPKFPKPTLRAKKSIQVPSKNNVRISGICNLPETPVINKLAKNRFTMQQHLNKENNSYLSNMNKKKVATPKLTNPPVKHRLPDTPLSNISFKSSSDVSFLQKEKEINDYEEKTKALAEEPTLEKITEVSPPVSTPFKEYRNVKDFFNNTNDNSVLYNDTIMSFNNKDSEHKENSREESVIVSLCDLLNKATVSTNNTSTELNDLIEEEKLTVNNIRMIENGIKTLQNIKELQHKSLQNVRKLINEKHTKNNCDSDKNATLTTKKERDLERNIENSSMKSPSTRLSVIKMKSPSYKIPKKNLCLRKKVFHKSMPDVSNEKKTPEKNDKALSMYMQMKERMNFLNTPLVKHQNIQGVVDTPSVTSHNLQMQLDKLYNAS